MSRSQAGASAGKKAFLIIFVIVFLAIAGLILYGMNKQSKSGTRLEDGRSQIILEERDGKTVLNDDLLRCDYKVYVENQKTGINILLIIIGAVGVCLVAIFISNLVNVIRKTTSGEGAGITGIISLVVSAAFLIGGGLFLYKGAGSLMDEKDKKDPETEELHVSTVQVTRKDMKVKKSGTKKHKTSHTEYYVYLADGTSMNVASHVYDEVTGSGIYFVGKDDAGAVFGMYPEAEYCKEEN